MGDRREFSGGGSEISLQVTGPKTVSASFILNQYELTAGAGPGGAVSGSGTYSFGALVNLVATADEGYSLLQWTLDGQVIGGKEMLVEMTGDVNATASFTLNQYELITNTGAGGAVSGAGTYDHGSVVNLVAIADEGYHFAGWSINGAEVAGGTETEVEMTGVVNATASFSLNQYELLTTVVTGGVVEGNGTYDHGSVASLVATADEGISFCGLDDRWCGGIGWN